MNTNSTSKKELTDYLEKNPCPVFDCPVGWACPFGLKKMITFAQIKICHTL
jgi:hypothetical protein